MKSIKHVLAVLVAIGLSSFMMAGACDDAAESLCGPCGSVANGDATITGNAEVDGIFKAVGTLKAATGSIRGDFDARVRAMAMEVFGIAKTELEGQGTIDVVGMIEAKFEADIMANIEGGLKINYQPPKCEADVNVAVSAQAQCEAKVDASCSAEVECTGGELSFECEGSCEGSCDVGCTMPSCTITVEPGEANCSGTCQGSCVVEMDASLECSGKCEGECDGHCSAMVENASGQAECAGSCDGECNGECVVEGSAAAECSGECRGECKLKGPDAKAECSEEELGCSGSCEGRCSGSCEGTVSAPKCEGHAECSADASADCKAQASAQASASLKCSPPSLSIDFNFAAGADAAANAEAKAAFMAKLEKFKVHMVAILQAQAQLRALVDTDYASEMGIKCPVVAITASIEALVKKVASGDFEIKAPGLFVCAGDALGESKTILSGLAGDVDVTMKGQARLYVMLFGE
jgi:modification target Cys-rich repeat protein